MDTTISHSQSGILARELGKNSTNIINVNPAYLGEKKKSNETIIRGQNDPVSMLLNKSDVDYNIKTNTINPLKNHKQDILDKIDDTEIIGKGIKGINWCIFRQLENTYKIGSYFFHCRSKIRPLQIDK